MVIIVFTALYMQLAKTLLLVLVSWKQKVIPLAELLVVKLQIAFTPLQLLTAQAD